MEDFTVTNERRQPFHIATQSSSIDSIPTLQRAQSHGRARSKSRSNNPKGFQTQVYSNGLLNNPSMSQSVVDQPESQRPSHRSSDSLGRVKDEETHNKRWSKSTASSRESYRQRSASLSRRTSLGGSGLFNFGIDSSPKKLHKARPSTADPNSPPRQPVRPVDPPIDLKPILPPILTLPSLQTSVNNDSRSTDSPSTAGLLSAAYRSATLGEDYFSTGKWTVQTQDFSQKRSPSRSQSASIDPSPDQAIGPAPKGLRTNSQAEEEGPSGGHSRNRSQAGKSSAGTGSSRSSRQPFQKAMLSKALQKANTAVLLDNAQNVEGAIQAYSEACALLQQVMLRSSGDEDKRKLEAIRNTYKTRIDELTKLAPDLNDDGKALPARPESEVYTGDELQSPDDDEPVMIETATVTRIGNDQAYLPEYQSRLIPTSQLPRRRESLLPSALEKTQQNRPWQTGDPYSGQPFSRPSLRDRVTEMGENLAPPMDSQYMPPPLSPRRPKSPIGHGSPSNLHERQPSADLSSSNLSGTSTARTHTRVPSNESMSWLDTIDESGGSAGSAVSSVHSRTSSMGVRRKNLRGASGASDAEFDAALDAAVEAAYDDGFEPIESLEPSQYDYEEDEVVLNVRRRVELAKERVRESEREAAIEEARNTERKRLLQKQEEPPKYDDNDYEDDESEEEERILDEMTRGFVMDDFEFGLQSKSALPRESDSSGFSGRTWNSSIGSNPTTSGTALSTVTESSAMPSISVIQQSRTPPPKHPPPAQALPHPPNPPSQPPSATTQSVRSRRLSGQNAQQLKIETTTKALTGRLTQPPSMPPPQVPVENGAVPHKTGGLPQQRQLPNGSPIRPPIPQSARQASSPLPSPGPPEILSHSTPDLIQPVTHDGEPSGQSPRSGSPGRIQSRSGLRKNFSSSSLKNMKSHNLSVSHAEEIDDVSPNTPLSSHFMARENNGRVPAIPTLPTPIAIAFKDRMNGAPTGGLYLFNSDIHSPESPGSPNPMSSGGPIPLEPCPSEFSLRPFWFMRALYQTLAHPKGGYLTTKLFVPRDVWRVKGVKIKYVEDKIANCDFLSAALLKLARVDTFDADAVLEEMQSLEGILEQVQITLSKKLGNEVGVQGSGSIFKDTSFGGDAEIGHLSKSGTMSTKSSSFSWRRLRSKNSAVGLSSSYSNKTPVDGPKEGLTISTLPMTSTSIAKTRFAKRDVSQVHFSGPNANYMGALARLFDAAQVIDQIARQVEDPGLRHADKTQVGLDLCTRHAAEFFGFYICRFVLTDIGTLLDKFIKRGTEWVLV